jgi:enoyl-[acyl-carrier-protein] reductase (NADH)
METLSVGLDGRIAIVTGASEGLGRFGEAHEFADLVAFLCSERAAYITGTTINFDGGMSATL